MLLFWRSFTNFGAEAWAALDSVPVSKSCRVMKLLDLRAFELKSAVHVVLDHVWNSLVQVDAENGRVAIVKNRPGKYLPLLLGYYRTGANLMLSR